MHRLYFSYVVRRNYSSPGHNGSTSTTSRAQIPQLLTQLIVDYFVYVVRPSSSSTTSPMLCDRVPRLLA
jgi:hypothetical protein